MKEDSWSCGRSPQPGWPGRVLAQTPAEDVTAAMEGELAANVLEGCGSELAEFCSAVTPGQGRVLACLYAHGDKLSGRARYRALRLGGAPRARDQRGHLRRQRLSHGAQDALRARGARRGDGWQSV